MLTPLPVDARHPFPRLPNLSFSLLLELRDQEDGTTRTAIVQVPSVLPRFVRLPGPGHAFVLLEDEVAMHVRQQLVARQAVRGDERDDGVDHEHAYDDATTAAARA